MEISSIPAVQATSTTTTSSDSSVLSSDFEVFLQMLTAQAEYQDPLDPVSSSDYAAQLAQFSMVEQQVLTNELLESQSQNVSGTGQIQDPSTWLGLDVRTRQSVPFVGDPISLDVSPPPSADEMTLKVYNSADQLVYESPVDVRSGSVTWPGTDNSNVPVATGNYRVEVESRLRGDLLQTDTFTGFSRVNEVQIAGGQTKLILEDGTTISQDDIIGLRESAT